MSAGLATVVALCGGVGALLRLLVGRAVVARTGRGRAAGTFVVNVSGAFLLGLLVGVAPSREAMLAAGSGLIGGYTTFSTWMDESRRLAAAGAGRAAALNVAASMAAGLLAVWLGRLVGGGG